MESAIVQSPRMKHKFFHALSEGLYQQWVHGHFTDTTVKVGQKTFECHRIVLSAMSPYFEAMYLSGMIESQNGNVTIQDVEADIFESILKFLYTGEDILTEENVEGVLRAAAMMQIKCLQESCETFMKDNVDIENCLAVWKLSTSHECRNLARKAWEYVLSYFEDICETEDFLKLDVDDVLAIIKDNDLVVYAEETVCDAVLRWIEHDKKNRAKHTSCLFEHLRLPLMQPEYLLENLDSHELLKDNVECKMYIEEAKRYQLLPARKHEFVSARIQQRNRGMCEEAVLLIGGNLHPEKTTHEVFGYSLKRNRWIRLQSLPYDLGVEFAVCSYGDAVFVSGGSENLQGMIYLHTIQNSWTECAKMFIGRRRHCMVAVGDSIFVLGGFDDEECEEHLSTLMSVEKFGVMSGRWEDCGYLTFPVRSASASVSQDKIFIFGGINSHGNKLDAVQCFDTRVRTCSQITNLPSLSGLSSTVVCNKTTYLVFPNGRILKMEAGGEITPLGAVPDFDRCGFGVVQHEGVFLIMGGINSSDIYDEVITYDPDKNEAAPFGQDMLRPLFGFGCVKARVHSGQSLPVPEYFSDCGY